MASEKRQPLLIPAWYVLLPSRSQWYSRFGGNIAVDGRDERAEQVVFDGTPAILCCRPRSHEKIRRAVKVQRFNFQHDRSGQDHAALAHRFFIRVTVAGYQQGTPIGNSSIKGFDGFRQQPCGNLVQAVEHHHDPTLGDHPFRRVGAVDVFVGQRRVVLQKSTDHPGIQVLFARIPRGSRQQQRHRLIFLPTVQQADGKQQREHGLSCARISQDHDLSCQQFPEQLGYLAHIRRHAVAQYCRLGFLLRLLVGCHVLASSDRPPNAYWLKTLQKAQPRFMLPLAMHGGGEIGNRPVQLFGLHTLIRGGSPVSALGQPPPHQTDQRNRDGQISAKHACPGTRPIHPSDDQHNDQQHTSDQQHADGQHHR